MCHYHSTDCELEDDGLAGAGGGGEDQIVRRVEDVWESAGLDSVKDGEGEDCAEPVGKGAEGDERDALGDGQGMGEIEGALSTAVGFGDEGRARWKRRRNGW